MAYLLSASGHEAIEAHEGAEGLAKARAESPDLVLLDIHMPQMDGFEVARRLRADPGCRAIPLVAVTALAMVGDRERIIAAGFDGYVAKPIDPEAFLCLVSQYTGSRSAKPVADVPPAPAPAAPARKRAMVVLVDNTQANIDVVRGVLEPSGFAVAAARSAREGLALARRLKPDLIISDVHMPKVDGFQFMQAVRADPELAGIPFVFLSASVWTARDRLLAMAQGGDKFLSRPIEPQVLLNEVELAIGRRAP